MLRKFGLTRAQKLISATFRPRSPQIIFHFCVLIIPKLGALGDYCGGSTTRPQPTRHHITPKQTESVVGSINRLLDGIDLLTNGINRSTDGIHQLLIALIS